MAFFRYTLQICIPVVVVVENSGMGPVVVEAGFVIMLTGDTDAVVCIVNP